MPIPNTVNGTDTFKTWRLATNDVINGYADRTEHSGAPTANDDSVNTSSNGVFRTGSVWIDISNDEVWICVDSTATAAVWKNVSLDISELGTIAIQDSDTVSITGGSITGITDLAIADGGTGASTAPGARTNLDVYSKAESDSSAIALAIALG